MDKCGEYGLTEFPTKVMVEPDNLAPHKALIMGWRARGWLSRSRGDLNMHSFMLFRGETGTRCNTILCSYWESNILHQSYA